MHQLAQAVGEGDKLLGQDRIRAAEFSESDHEGFIDRQPSETRPIRAQRAAQHPRIELIPFGAGHTESVPKPIELFRVDLAGAAHLEVVSGAVQLRPEDAMLGEEGGLSSDDRSGRPGQLCWVVDPIDGTVNYLYGFPWYAVSVAVTREGVALAGAVVEPDSGRVWSASRGGGATLDGRPLRASSADELDMALVGTGFSYSKERRRRQGELASALLTRVRDIRRAGAASLDLCAVAAGWLDGYYEHEINPWDWAAGALVCTEAGATVHLPDPGAPYGNAIVAARATVEKETAILILEGPFETRETPAVCPESALIKRGLPQELVHPAEDPASLDSGRDHAIPGDLA